MLVSLTNQEGGIRSLIPVNRIGRLWSREPIASDYFFVWRAVDTRLETEL